MLLLDITNMSFNIDALLDALHQIDEDSLIRSITDACTAFFDDPEVIRECIKAEVQHELNMIRIQKHRSRTAGRQQRLRERENNLDFLLQRVKRSLIL